LSARLSSHLAEPYLDIHPTDAAQLNICPADLVEVKSPHATCILRARITTDVSVGQVFAPMHWTGETAPSARIDALVTGAVDPISGQPESKAAVVSVHKFEAAWYGFAVSLDMACPKSDYWAMARTEAGYRVELAGRNAPQDWEQSARALFDLPNAQITSFSDPARNLHRLAFHAAGRLLAAIFIAPEPVAVMRDYLATRPGEDVDQILTGRTPADVPDPGPVLCSCFGVGINTIARAVEADRLMTVEEIGQSLRAGTNCGSCKPEIANLLKTLTLPQAAE
ncbi:MAG: molybdopterin dinucleotide binding domain-containing protein, partial [Pseudomonadota bacterium]